MELSKETIKKIRGLIVFTALITACLWKYDVVVGALGFVFHIIFPFILGGAIAFVLNVPMNFVERNLFSERRVRGKKYAKNSASGQYVDRDIRSDRCRKYRDVRLDPAAWDDIFQSWDEYTGIYSQGTGMG